jgi:hypothetical protein
VWRAIQQGRGQLAAGGPAGQNTAEAGGGLGSTDSSGNVDQSTPAGGQA